MIEAISVKVGDDYKSGKFIYGLFGCEEDRGILECDYEEDNNEDIYGEIHEWIDEHIEVYTKILYDGKELLVSL